VNTHFFARLRAFKPNSLTLAACIALAAGFFVYAFARPVAPEFIHSLRHLTGFGAQQVPLFAFPGGYQLPSFVHMLALLLLAAAVTQHQPRLRIVALVLTFTLGLVMEFVQHPAVSKSVSACTQFPCSLLTSFEAYSRTGTFDPLDIYAIVAAGATTFALLLCLPPHGPETTP